MNIYIYIYILEEKTLIYLDVGAERTRHVLDNNTRVIVCVSMISWQKSSRHLYWFTNPTYNSYLHMDSIYSKKITCIVYIKVLFSLLLFKYRYYKNDKFINI